MQDIQEEVFSEKAINYHLIPTKKFKTMNIVVKSKAKLNRNTITNRALLPYVLEKGTKTYPTEQLLMRQLDELYGAQLFIDGSKKGNYHVLTYRIEVANEKFLPNETSMTEKALHLLHDIIFNPYVEEGVFSEKIVSREKATLKNKITSIQDDKMAYANMRLLDTMCQDEVYHLHKNGYEEDLSSITAASLFDYYQQMLKEDEIDVYLVGDMNVNDMKQKVSHSFHHEHVENKTIVAEDDTPTTIEPKEIVEKQPIQQAKLHIGYRTNITYSDDDYFALHVFNGIFGGFPSSKLFIEVREKESLAYYAASRMESHKGLLLVVSGIEPSDFVKTKDIIHKQMDDMKKGQFQEEDITNVKELIISDIKETLDHSQGIVELLYQQVVGRKKLLPADFMEGIQNVTKDDVIRVAKKITPDTVYILTNEEGDVQDA